MDDKELSAQKTAPAEASARPAPAEEKDVYKLVGDHLKSSSSQLHAPVHEHARLRGLHSVEYADQATGLMKRYPHWQIRALLARFHAQGLREDSNIAPDVLDKALHEALHGRI